MKSSFQGSKSSFSSVSDKWFLQFTDTTRTLPISVAVQSTALVCGLSIAGIAGSNTDEGMDIRLFWSLSAL